MFAVHCVPFRPLDSKSLVLCCVSILSISAETLVAGRGGGYRYQKMQFCLHTNKQIKKNRDSHLTDASAFASFSFSLT